ncbi:hypothetical protein LTR17_017524 [Elasticomyces elasticus]|nr:hypothetical protein LTR17_017524 [Elasticomyces elasticus]
MRTTIIFLAVATMATTIAAVPLYKENGLFKPYYGGHGPVCSPEFPCPGVSIPPRPQQPNPAGGMDGLGKKHDDLNPSMWLNGVPENQDATVEARSWEEHFDSNGNIIPNPDMPKVDKRHSGRWVPVEPVGEPEALDAAVEARSWEEFFDANGNIIPNPDMPAVDKKRCGDWVPAEWSGDEEYNEEYPEVNVKEYPEVNVTEYPEVNVEEYPEVNVEEYPEVNVEEYPKENNGEDVIPIPPSRPSSDE